MSVLHHVEPIDEDLIQKVAENPDFRAWLKHNDVELSHDIPYGRYPTPRELRRILDSMPGIQVEYLLRDLRGDPLGKYVWDAYISSDGDFTEIWVQNFEGDEDVMLPFFFRRGSRLVHRIAQEVVNLCGSYLLMLNNYGELIVLQPEAEKK